MNVVILSPILVEHKAILTHLSEQEDKLVDGVRFLQGSFKGKYHTFNLITQQTGSKTETIALATEKAIRLFQPVVVLLTGVAGGVKDVRIGDVVVGTKYYGYESGKETKEGFVARPESGYYSKELQSVAQMVAGNTEWKKRILNNTSPNVVFGAIASGNKVVASTDSEAFHLLKKSYNDTTALEMEAIGFGQAMQSYPTIRFLNIRGISDLLEGKSAADEGGSQERAAENMAAFVFELLYQLDVSNFKIIGMEIKELSKKIVAHLLPVGTSSSEESTGEEKVVKTLWEKVRPLLKDDLAALEKTPDDLDVQADARSTLRKALVGKEQLQMELTTLVETLSKSQAKSTSFVAENSTGVFQGKNISVGGNIHIGDIINHHLGSTTPINEAPFTRQNLEEVKTLISKGSVEKAIDILLSYAKPKNQETFNEIIGIARQWGALNKDIRIGVISSDEKFRTASKITYNLLSITDKLHVDNKPI